MLTLYEVSMHGEEGWSMARWATWARLLKEVSQVLLVTYSAFNPVAYCRELFYR